MASAVAPSRALTGVHGHSDTVVVQQLQDYRLGRELGRGGYGTVYEALDVRTGESVAVKRIPAHSTDREKLAEVEAEIRMLSALRHENVVRYIETVRTPQYLYIVTELLESGSLSGVVKRFGTLSEPLAALYIAQALAGLLFLHDQGVVHHDIKAANILLTKTGLVKLADFGVAALEAEVKGAAAAASGSGSHGGSGTGSGSGGLAGGGTLGANVLVGSPYWMSPEKISMTAAGSLAPSDIWAVGATVLELIIGKPPYFDLNPMTAMFRIVQDAETAGGPPIPPTVSPALGDFLACCFRKEPSLRRTAAELMRHPWITTAVASLESSRARGARGGMGGSSGGTGTGASALSTMSHTENSGGTAGSSSTAGLAGPGDVTVNDKAWADLVDATDKQAPTTTSSAGEAPAAAPAAPAPAAPAAPQRRSVQRTLTPAQQVPGGATASNASASARRALVLAHRRRMSQARAAASTAAATAVPEAAVADSGSISISVSGTAGDATGATTDAQHEGGSGGGGGGGDGDTDAEAVAEFRAMNEAALANTLRLVRPPPLPPAAAPSAAITTAQPTAAPASAAPAAPAVTVAGAVATALSLSRWQDSDADEIGPVAAVKLTARQPQVQVQEAVARSGSSASSISRPSSAASRPASAADGAGGGAGAGAGTGNGRGSALLDLASFVDDEEEDDVSAVVAKMTAAAAAAAGGGGGKGGAGGKVAPLRLHLPAAHPTTATKAPAAAAAPAPAPAASAAKKPPQPPSAAAAADADGEGEGEGEVPLSARTASGAELRARLASRLSGAPTHAHAATSVAVPVKAAAVAASLSLPPPLPTAVALPPPPPAASPSDDPFALFDPADFQRDARAEEQRNAQRLTLSLLEQLAPDKVAANPGVVRPVVSQLLRMYKSNPSLREHTLKNHGAAPLLALLSGMRDRPYITAWVLRLINGLCASDTAEDEGGGRPQQQPQQQQQQQPRPGSGLGPHLPFGSQATVASGQTITEALALLGALPLLLSFTDAQHSAPVRAQAAGFARLLLAGSTLALQLFVACSGTGALVALLSPSPMPEALQAHHRRKSSSVGSVGSVGSADGGARTASAGTRLARRSKVGSSGSTGGRMGSTGSGSGAGSSSGGGGGGAGGLGLTSGTTHTAAELAAAARRIVEEGWDLEEWSDGGGDAGRDSEEEEEEEEGSRDRHRDRHRDRLRRRTSRGEDDGTASASDLDVAYYPIRVPEPAAMAAEPLPLAATDAAAATPAAEQLMQVPVAVAVAVEEEHPAAATDTTQQLQRSPQPALQRPQQPQQPQQQQEQVEENAAADAVVVHRTRGGTACIGCDRLLEHFSLLEASMLATALEGLQAIFRLQSASLTANELRRLLLRSGLVPPLAAALARTQQDLCSRLTEICADVPSGLGNTNITNTDTKESGDSKPTLATTTAGVLPPPWEQQQEQGQDSSSTTTTARAPDDSTSTSGSSSSKSGSFAGPPSFTLSGLQHSQSQTLSRPQSQSRSQSAADARPASAWSPQGFRTLPLSSITTATPSTPPTSDGMLLSGRQHKEGEEGEALVDLTTARTATTVTTLPSQQEDQQQPLSSRLELSVSAASGRTTTTAPAPAAPAPAAMPDDEALPTSIIAAIDNMVRFADVAVLLSQGDSSIKMSSATADVLSAVLAVLQPRPACLLQHRMYKHAVARLLKALKWFSMEPSVIDTLYQAGGIGVLVSFLASLPAPAPTAAAASVSVSVSVASGVSGSASDAAATLLAMQLQVEAATYHKEVQAHVLHCLFLLCRVSRERQTAAAVAGVIPLLQRALQSSAQLKPLAIPLLCDMAHCGTTARQALWEADGVRTYISILRDATPAGAVMGGGAEAGGGLTVAPAVSIASAVGLAGQGSEHYAAPALSALAVWCSADAARVSRVLVQPECVGVLDRVFVMASATAASSGSSGGSFFEAMLVPFAALVLATAGAAAAAAAAASDSLPAATPATTASPWSLPAALSCRPSFMTTLSQACASSSRAIQMKHLLSILRTVYASAGAPGSPARRGLVQRYGLQALVAGIATRNADRVMLRTIADGLLTDFNHDTQPEPPLQPQTSVQPAPQPAV